MRVLAARSTVAVARARDTPLIALAVFLDAARFLAVAASCGTHLTLSVDDHSLERRAVVELGLVVREQSVSLLVWLPILAASALTGVCAEATCPQTLTV